MSASLNERKTKPKTRYQHTLELEIEDLDARGEIVEQVIEDKETTLADVCVEDSHGITDSLSSTSSSSLEDVPATTFENLSHEVENIHDHDFIPLDSIDLGGDSVAVSMKDALDMLVNRHTKEEGKEEVGVGVEVGVGMELGVGVGVELEVEEKKLAREARRRERLQNKQVKTRRPKGVSPPVDENTCASESKLAKEGSEVKKNKTVRFHQPVVTESPPPPAQAPPQAPPQAPLPPSRKNTTPRERKRSTAVAKPKRTRRSSSVP